MSYTTVEAQGDPVSADRPLYIYIYPNNSALDDDVSAMNNGFSHALDQLYDYSAIDYYELNNYDGYISTSKDDNKDEFYREFKDFLKYGLKEERKTNYLDYKGSHLGVSGGFNGGLADPGDGSDPTSFTGGQIAVAGTLYSVKQHYKNVAIQEAFHPAIDCKLSSNADMTEPGKTPTDHDFGKCLPGHSNAVSPMATGYEGSHAGHGDCGNANWSEYYSTFLTACTKEAVKNTALAET